MKQILTTGDIAKYCGVNLRTVIRWIERGHLKAYKLPGRGDNRIQMDDFLAFLDQNQMPLPDDLKVTTPNVLVIEKDGVISTAIKAALGDQTANIRSVSNGFQAGLLVSSFNPHLIVIDLDSVPQEAEEIVDYLHSTPAAANTRTVVFSSQPDEDRGRLGRHGVDEVLAKPLKPAEFVRTYQRLCS